MLKSGRLGRDARSCFSMEISEEEKTRYRRYIRQAVELCLQEDAIADDWIFRSRGMDRYARMAGINPESVRDAVRKLRRERDSKLEKFEF